MCVLAGERGRDRRVESSELKLGSERDEKDEEDEGLLVVSVVGISLGGPGQPV